MSTNLFPVIRSVILNSNSNRSLVTNVASAVRIKSIIGNQRCNNPVKFDVRIRKSLHLAATDKLKLLNNSCEEFCQNLTEIFLDICITRLETLDKFILHMIFFEKIASRVIG